MLATMASSASITEGVKALMREFDVTYGPERTLVHSAANGRSEPIVQSAASCLYGWFGQEADVDGKTGLSFRMFPRVPCLKLETVLSWMQMRP